MLPMLPCDPGIGRLFPFETLLAEQIRYNLEYRWFVGLGTEGETWDGTALRKTGIVHLPGR
jgi:Transposase domain (DUF772)